METKILITAAEGNLGREVLAVLAAQGVLARAGYAGSPLAGREPVRFDYALPETYPAAFSGIERMLLSGLPGAAGVKRWVVPAVEAAIQAGVKYFIVHSRLGVEKLPHSAESALERYLARTKISVTFLRCGFPMQTVLSMHEAEMRNDGVLRAPLGDARLGFVDRRDLAATAACTLMDAGHSGRVYDLTGAEALDYGEVADIYGEVFGRTVRYLPQTESAYLLHLTARGISPGQAWQAARLYSRAHRAMRDVVSRDLADILKRRPQALKAWLAERKSAGLAQPSD